jgi:hypothetical protein
MQSVLIASRDAATRKAVRTALDPREVRVVAEACGRWRAGELVRALGPDAVVAGVNLLAAHEFFLAGWGPVSREVSIIAVGPEDPQLARLLVAQGVAAYIVLDRLAEELPACLGAASAAGVEDRAHLAGDLPVLVGGDDVGAYRRAAGRDVGVGLGARVGVGVDRDAQEAEAVGGQRPDLGRVLADAAGEHECVEAAERSSHRGDAGA